MTMQRQEMVGALEAVIFAAGEPVSASDLRKIFARLWKDVSESHREQLETELKEAIKELRARWVTDPGASDDDSSESPDNGRGFELTEVADGFTFRSNPRYADALRAMREQRPQRLSRAALETLAIVAYRQPVTKPEADHIRGVDCGGTLRLLLDRGLVRIVGKKEEPGRPLLYGTTKEFLSFFNLRNLSQLPTLREFHELTDESREQLEAFDEGALKDLSESARKVDDGEEPAVTALDDAVEHLKSTEAAARDALASQGLQLDHDKGASEPPRQDAGASPDAEPGGDAGAEAAQAEGASEPMPPGDADKEQNAP